MHIGADSSGTYIRHTIQIHISIPVTSDLCDIRAAKNLCRNEDLQPAATLDSRVILNFWNITKQEDKVSWLLVSWGKTDEAESHSNWHENKNTKTSEESVRGTTAFIFSFL